MYSGACFVYIYTYEMLNHCILKVILDLLLFIFAGFQRWEGLTQAMQGLNQTILDGRFR